ncbi:MAG: hypothetical protein ABSB09_09865 [Acidimicrobiales bacterium]
MEFTNRQKGADAVAPDDPGPLAAAPPHPAATVSGARTRRIVRLAIGQNSPPRQW